MHTAEPCALGHRGRAAPRRGVPAAASGGSSRACPTPTTPTRTRTSCPRRSGFPPRLNPHYFINPPAYTYLLHVVFDLWFGGRAGVSHAYATNPTEVFVVARVTSAVLGTLAVGCCTSRRAHLRPPRRPARRRAARGRVPAGLLLAPRAQRRADAGADLPLAVGDGAGPARGGRATTRSAGVGPRAGVRDEVHRRDRAAAAARGGGGAVPRAGGGAALRGLAARRRRSPSPPSSSPTRTRSSTTARSTRA